MPGDLLPNRFEGFSGVCDIVDDGNSPSLDEVRDGDSPDRVRVPHFVGLAPGQADREELAAESTGDGCGREEARTSDADNLIQVAGLEPLREAPREICESIPGDRFDAVAIGVIVAPHFGPDSRLTPEGYQT